MRTVDQVKKSAGVTWKKIFPRSVARKIGRARRSGHWLVEAALCEAMRREEQFLQTDLEDFVAPGRLNEKKS